MSVPALEMKVLRPLITQPPSWRSARVRMPRASEPGIGLGEAERAERPPLGQRAQPALALRVVAEEEQRQRADGDVGLPRRGDRLVGQPDLLHGGDEADGRHADAAPLLGDEHPEQAERSHLAEQVGRAARLLPGRRAPGGRSRSARSPGRARPARARVRPGRSPSPPSYGLTGTTPVHWCRCRQTGSRTSSQVRHRRRGAPPPQAAAGRRLPPLRPARLRRGHGRPHHRPRPRAARPLLGQPARHELPPDPGQGSPAGQPRGRGRRGQLAAQPGRVRHPLPDPRGPARRRVRRALALRVRQGVVDPAPAARPADPGRLRLLRGPRACSTTTPAPCSTSKRASGSPTPSATARRPSWPTTACSPSGARSTRRRGGSSPWSARARPSCWPRPPARPVLIRPDVAEKTAGQTGGHRTGWYQFQPLYDQIVAEEPDLLEE